jgi:hypothetical protein
VAHDSRRHIVLVPGFVGFDALGQLRYYAGVTQLFDDWKSPSHRGDVSIHYFDNYPTASVKLRSQRLRDYLAQRIARGEFAAGDSVALVGHSTGGLDIRMLVHDLAEEVAAAAKEGKAPAVTDVDGPATVPHTQILERIERIAFVSVPHFGTNLADFASGFRVVLQSLAKDAAAGLALNHGVMGRVRSTLTGPLGWFRRSDLLLAVLDALDESDENPFDPPDKRASEREARYELTAWLENMANDFASIDDLRVVPRCDRPTKSPAHFSASEREAELRSWKKYGIRVHSWATRVPRAPEGTYCLPPLLRPFVAGLRRAGALIDLPTWLVRRAPGRWLLPPVALLDELSPYLEAPALPVAAGALLLSPSGVFDLVFAACGDPGGPFGSALKRASIAPTVRAFETSKTVDTSDISPEDNDGIVNTLSMLWPFTPDVTIGPPIDLVEADHADVLGHFALQQVPEHSDTLPDRVHYAYDIFQQPKFKFQQPAFARLWRDIFEFCTSPSLGCGERGVPPEPPQPGT